MRSRPTTTAAAALLAALTVTAPLLATLLASPAAAYAPPPPGPTTTLSNPANDTTNPAIAFDDSGAGLAAWVESSGTTHTLWAARFDPASGWSAPRLVQSSEPSTLGVPRIALALGGNASIWWIRYTSPYELWVAQSAGAGSSWNATPVRTTPAGIYYLPDVKVSASGHAFAMWEESNSSSSAWAAFIDPAGKLSGPTRLDNGSAPLRNFALAVAGNGTATALWQDWNGSALNLSYARFAPATGWSAPALAYEGANGAAGFMSAAADRNGNIHIMFDRRNLGPSALVASRSPPGGPWGPFEVVHPAGSIQEAPSLVPADDGSVLAVWAELNYDGFDFLDSLYTARFDPGAGWGAPRQFTDNVSGFPQYAVAVRPQGDALLVFGPPANGTYTIHVSQYTHTASCRLWSDPVDAGLVNASSNYLAAAMAPDGHGAMLAWGWNGAHQEIRATPIELAPAPHLEVTAPTAGQAFVSPLAAITGTALPGSTVRSGSLTTTADGSGGFLLVTPLSPGPNTLDVEASDPAEWPGCAVGASVTVTYSDPVPGLLANLSAAQADLAAAQERIGALEASGNATQAELDAARADLDAANVTIAGLASDMADIASDLNATQEELGRVKVRFPWLQDNLTAAQEEVAGLQGEVTSLEAQYGQSQAALEEAQSQIVLLKAQQNQTDTLLQESTDNNAALSGQVATLSLVAFIALLAAIAGIGLSLVQARGGGGGGAQTRAAHELTHVAQQGGAGPDAADAGTGHAPAEEQLKGAPRH